MPNILIIEDDAAFCKMLQKFLTKHDHQVTTSFSAADAKSILSEMAFDVVLTDVRLPNYDGIQLLTDIKESNPNTQVILMTGYAQVSAAVKAMKNGAFDYIAKPFTPTAIVALVESALQAGNTISVQTSSASKPKEPIKEVEIRNEADSIKGVSEASIKLQEHIALVAPTDMSVLITGDSGTGKEVTAKAIHDLSKRRQHNFVAVDCGAIPKELAASEFFGHIKGSFTGAIADKIGNFEAANGGTLFLDEVGNLSYGNQIQLLRVLQERKVKKVGSTKEVQVDVRIITATNEDLSEAVANGTFREDLFHRLNEFSIQLPSLQDRFQDLPLFSDFFLKKANAELNKDVLVFSKEVQNAFKIYHWPGNLRELQNVIKRSVLLSTRNEVLLSALPKEIATPNAESTIKSQFSKSEFEKDRIIKALERTNYNKSEAAKLLQVTRKTLYNRINHYKLDL